MAYNALVESVRLITGDPVAGAQPLTRRRRTLPVAVDVDDDVAVTVFLRRAHGGAEWRTHLFHRIDDRWHSVGGGGWGLDRLDVLTRVPTAAELGGPARGDGGGGALTGARWLSYTMIKTSVDVATVSVASRTLVRPAHGYVAVVWAGRRAIPATILDKDGHVLTTLQLSG